MSNYIGRFAPSCTGPLHAGSLVAALASWLDARAHGGVWLVRLEDVDTQRCLPGTDQIILQQLCDCGLVSDAPALLQSQRSAIYQRSIDQLLAADSAYPCACSRQDIETALRDRGQPVRRHAELIYPGTCRAGLRGQRARAWRVRTDADATIFWNDRRLGRQQQNVWAQVGDFVLKRADGCFAYQLAVVVDDALQGISDVVRGEDLADNTARQILLQQLLGLPTPRYLHTPLVRDRQGEKLSKQSGAPAIDTATPAAALAALNHAAGVLGLPLHGGPACEALSAWVAHWQRLYNRAP